MNMLYIMCVIALAFMPTIDGERVEFGAYEPDYWLGVSTPPWNDTIVTAFQGGQQLFTHVSGTDFELYYNTSHEPILFYNSGQYQGAIVPEPSVIALLMFGWFLMRRC